MSNSDNTSCCDNHNTGKIQRRIWAICAGDFIEKSYVTTGANKMQNYYNCASFHRDGKGIDVKMKITKWYWPEEYVHQNRLFV